jgi:hypothetical protein
VSGDLPDRLRNLTAWLLPVALVLATPLMFAATTATWELNGYQDFLRGRMEGLSLTRDGRLTLGPKVDTLFTADQAEIWSIARGPDGSLYAGTGNRGRLYRIDSSGRGTVLWTAVEPEIFAVTVDSKGVVYAGSSPDGKVYRIESGKATEYFAPQARYIWSLAIAADGALMVGTGDQGKIFRVTAAGQGQAYYETGQTHVTALAFDREGRLLAGSEPNGILYRITAPQRAFVLYDANLPEIRAIVPASDGSIYAAALGGSVAKRTGAASSSTATTTSSALPTFSTSVTVTDQQAGLNPAPTPEAPKASAAAAASTPVSSTTSTIEYSGVERSALYKIHPDNTVETLWSSKEENVYDLAISDSSIFFLTDAQGRIYRLEPDRKATLVAQANQGDATRLLNTPEGLYAATGGRAKILRLDNASASSGWFESPVHDSGAVARWGRISWRGNTAPALSSRAISFRTRTGNSSRPDATWSDWSEPVIEPDGSAISSPNARYIQWRAEFQGVNPALDSATLAYLPQNTPPTVRSISVSAKSSGTGAAASAAGATTGAAYSITVTDTGEAAPAAGTSAQTISRGAGQQIQVSWQADDPDGDKLLFSLYFRGEEESQWKLLRANMSENTYVLEGDVFADGRYYFRVTATDRPSNAAEAARQTELVSPPVLFDNSPPVVAAGQPRRNGTRVEVEVNAEDRGSMLRRCEYSVDAGPWMPVEASDGVTDSRREQFRIQIEGVAAGEHLIAVRVYDAAGNAGLAKVVVR